MAGNDYEQISLDVDGQVAVITLDRPEHRNAFTLTMSAELGEALADCDADDAIRAVVITGAGDTFCVGADLSDRAIGAPGGAAARPERPRLRPPAVRKPVIAAVNGHGVGVGVTLPMMCDLRLVAEDAKVGLPFVRRGVIGEFNSHWVLPRLVGLATAADLLLTGRLLTGAEAAAVGLFNRAVPTDRVLAEARAIAEDIAANTAPASVAVSKRLLWESLERSSGEAERREMQLFQWLAGQPDAQEGVASFLERRAPAWTMSPHVELPPDAPA